MALVVENLPANVGDRLRDTGLVPGLGRSPGEGKGCSFQYSGLENSMDCIVHGVAKSWTQLSDFHFTNQGEWRSGLPMQETQEIQVQSLGQEASLKKDRQPTPVFLPGKIHGQRSLVGYSPWGRKSQT